ncbi:MAG: hypothetical protein ACPL3C_00650 [Pyrobaculum sp.]|jgi:hypothetical protein|uniref:CDC48 N-terminal subdomain domain-containing protein n=1 Tax=Pyrobaculum ferrireducens TaxID=1104324 RepID=G7VH86_9CREN|nr:MULTISPECIES: hypothetical protein [Pyrobaculum]AET31989.1 hypothetical protein P186_0537 [Pyrobaculum ferrireducens]MCU7786559.1 hypothetical protein [Pyrobaculum sp. 3827-6]
MAERREVERGKRLLIPPYLSPQQERREQKKSERRAKIRHAEGVEDGVAKLAPDVYEELDKPAEVEIVAPGGSSHEKKKVFRAVLGEKIPSGEIHVSAEDLRALGIAEGTVVTVRKK